MSLDDLPDTVQFHRTCLVLQSVDTYGRHSEMRYRLLNERAPCGGTRLTP